VSHVGHELGSPGIAAPGPAANSRTNWFVLIKAGKRS
jgi:hypothetical protein